MSRKINNDTNVQIRISKELKEKAQYKAGKHKLSNYIRKLIEEDCK